MVWVNHWVQWFFDGFGVRQPLVLMVFDGCLPLVRRWNGNIPSLKSRVGKMILQGYLQSGQSGLSVRATAASAGVWDSGKEVEK